LVSEKIRREKVGSVPTLLLVASREQIRPVENVILVIILLPVKYLLKLSVSRNFYRLRMTSLTYVNECFHDFMFVNRAPPHAPVNLVDLQHWLQSLAKSLLHYSSTIRTIRRLFADYSYYSTTICGLFALFASLF
jgi:hypothetical protein